MSTEIQKRYGRLNPTYYNIDNHNPYVKEFKTIEDSKVCTSQKDNTWYLCYDDYDIQMPRPNIIDQMKIFFG